MGKVIVYATEVVVDKLSDTVYDKAMRAIEKVVKKKDRK